MFVRKLVISNLLNRRTRAALTIAAVALSVSLVVAVTTGYASVIGAVTLYLDKYLGTIDAQIYRQNDPHGPVAASILDGLRADPTVKRADGRIEIVTPLVDGAGKSAETRMATVIGVDRPRDTRIDMLRFHAGGFFNTNDGDVIVVDQALAEKMELKVGDSIGLAGARTKMLKVVGIVHKPEVMAQHMQTVYVPIRVLQQFQQWDAASTAGARVNRISIELNRGADPRAFEGRWKTELAKYDPAAKIKLTRDAREQIDKFLVVVELLSYLAGAVSMLAAMFIVFSALSMGVSERQRTLAMLRAVGATRSQVGQLVVLEGVLLSGLAAAVGAPLGWLWVEILSLIFPDFFSAGVVMSWGGVALGVGGSILAALAASILPAWQATRVDPLEAMSPDAAPAAARTPFVAAVAGLILVALDPLLFFGPIDTLVAHLGVRDPASLTINIKLILHFAIGLPGIMVGFFLLAPAVIKIVEALLASIVARAFSLNPALLRQQLSTGLWRAAGTASALMVGLAVLIVMQVQGTSSLKGWKLPTKFPDLFIVYPSAADIGGLDVPSTQPGTRVSTRPVQSQPAGKKWSPWDLMAAKMPAAGASNTTTQPAPASTQSAVASTQPAAPTLAGRLASLLSLGGKGPTAGVEINQVKVLEGVKGIRGNQIMPIAIASPQFGHGMTSIILTAMNPEATMFFGIDPTKAFDMMELEFRDGQVQVASKLLESGEAIRLKKDQTWMPVADLVGERDERPFAKLKGSVLDNGQILLQGSVRREGDTYIVDLPGGGTRRVPANQVEKIEHGRFLIVTNEFKELKGLGVGDSFALKRFDNRVVDYTIVGVVWSPGIDVIVSVFDMGRQFDQRTASSVFGSIRDARDDFGVQRIYLFAANLEPTSDRDTVVKEINKTLRTQGMKAGDVRQIKENITIAFDRLLLLASTVAFAALAVASLGVTNTVMAGIRSRRWQFGVLRSIGVTRSQLLRLVLSEAVLLGIVASVLGLAAGALLSLDAHALQVVIIGYNPPIAVPWGYVAIGVFIVMFIAIAASIWPARNVARTEPLALLQAGRATA